MQKSGLIPVSTAWRRGLLTFVFGSLICYGIGVAIGYHSGEVGGYLSSDLSDRLAPYLIPVWFLVFWLGGAVLAGLAAKRQGRRAWRWLVGSLFLLFLPHLVLSSRRFRDFLVTTVVGYAVGFLILWTFDRYTPTSLQERLDIAWAPYLSELSRIPQASIDGSGRPYIQGRAIVIENGHVKQALHSDIRAIRPEDVQTVILLDKTATVGTYGNTPYLGVSSTSSITIIDRLLGRVVARKSFSTEAPSSITVNSRGKRVGLASSRSHTVGEDSWFEASAWIHDLPRR